MELQGRRVAVVGMGGTFPTCSNIDEFSQKLFANHSLIRVWDEAVSFDKQVRSKVSGFITDEESDLQTIYSTVVANYPEYYVDLQERIPPANLATSDMGSIWAMRGSLDAIKMAGWTEQETQSENTGVVIGSGGCGHALLRPAWHHVFNLGGKSRSPGAHTVDRAMVYREAANVSCLIKNRGVCEALASACATGLGNIGYAYRLIKFGGQDRVIAGGVETTSIESLFGFDSMQVLSRGFAPEKSSRPFDMNRNGFVCSFGAGIVCLEEYESAKARGAEILGVIDSYFNNCDGDGDMFYPSFGGQRRLWKGLIGEKQMKPDVVKVHGTSTPAGDPVELFSVVDTLGTDGYHISAPKSQFGHMLGAAGAVEFITALMMLKEQAALGCVNSDELNPEQESIQKISGWEGTKEPMGAFRHLLPQESFKKEINTIACLNYGFGGTNSAMLLSRDGL